MNSSLYSVTEIKPMQVHPVIAGPLGCTPCVRNVGHHTEVEMTEGEKRECLYHARRQC